VLQERIESGITEEFIEHKPLDEFLINIHAFHNAHLIRAILPRDLTAPIPYTVDRRAHHDHIAETLRTAQDAKRAVTALKTAKKKKAVTVAIGTAREPLAAAAVPTPTSVEDATTNR
jgi:hypothetical protein